MSEARDKLRFLRPTAFRMGVLAGLATLGLAVWLQDAAYRSIGPSVGYDLEVVASGETLSKHGARRLELKQNDGLLLRQVCNGACDDLRYRAKAAGDSTFRVAVLDQKGGCISCDAGLYVSSGMSTIAQFSIRDDRTRLVNADYLRPAEGGSPER